MQIQEDKIGRPECQVEIVDYLRNGWSYLWHDGTPRNGADVRNSKIAFSTALGSSILVYHPTPHVDWLEVLLSAYLR